MKPHKISTHSAHSDNCYFHFFYQFSDWVEILWGFMKCFFKQMLKVSTFYLKNKKVLFLKKIFFRPLSISKQKSFVYWLNFPEGFGLLNLVSKDFKLEIQTIFLEHSSDACQLKLQFCKRASSIVCTSIRSKAIR